MAASLKKVGIQQHKRKVNELEDITNNDHFHGEKKLKMSFRNVYYKKGENREPQQQRSPSPTEVLSSSPSKSRDKSVTFDLEEDKLYVESPLLTPKDDEEEEEDDDSRTYEAQGPLDGVRADGRNASSTTGLNANADYIALTSTLRLLSNKKNTIELEIVRLSRVLQYHSTLSKNEEVIEFFMKLINNDLNLPKQNRILRCPLVDWSKYHRKLSDVRGTIASGSASDEKPLFKTLNLYNGS